MFAVGIWRTVIGIGVALGVVVVITRMVDRSARADAQGDPVRDLRDPEPRVRAAAARRLATVPRAIARPALEAALRDPDSAVRIAVVTSLCELGDRDVVSALRATLEDEPDAGVRAVIESTIERLA